MRRALSLAIVLVGLTALSGCACCFQNDNAFNAFYESCQYQKFVAWNDAHDVHAWYCTSCAKKLEALDCCGYDGYLRLHEYLTRPCPCP